MFWVQFGRIMDIYTQNTGERHREIIKYIYFPRNEWAITFLPQLQMIKFALKILSVWSSPLKEFMDIFLVRENRITFVYINRTHSVSIKCVSNIFCEAYDYIVLP